MKRVARKKPAHHVVSLMEAIVDVSAIAGLVTLGALHIASAEVIVPVISIIAAGSIGARMKKGFPSGGVSILALGALPFLGALTRRA